MKQFIFKNGLIHQKTCDTPQQNGVADQKNYILLKINRTLMIESNVTVHFLSEVIATATTTYLTNCNLKSVFLFL